MTEPTFRRFPAPWIVVELQECFQIEDANGFALSYVYFAADPQRRSETGRMSKNEARRIAINMAAVPELREAVRDHEKRF
jgi:hypothetical protein